MADTFIAKKSNEIVLNLVVFWTRNKGKYSDVFLQIYFHVRDQTGIAYIETINYSDIPVVSENNNSLDLLEFNDSSHPLLSLMSALRCPLPT